MDFRASKENIREYIDQYTNQVYSQILEGGEVPDFTPSITVNPAQNGKAFKRLIKDVVDSFPSHLDMLDVTASEIEVQCKSYCNDYLPVDDIDREYSYPEFKKMIRNTLLYASHNVGIDTHDDGFTMLLHDRQFRSNWRNTCRIIVKDGKFEVHVIQQETESKDNPFGLRTNVGEPRTMYTLPPLKLTKLLKKIGCSEKFCTFCATQLSNKPRNLSIKFTDKYIPECYISMHKKVASCMSHESSFYNLPNDMHPTLPYDECGDEVVLALVQDDDNADSDWPFVARAIVNVEEWGANTVYGLEFIDDLSPWGLGTYASMQGISLNLISNGEGNYLAPYVDGTDCLFDVRLNSLVVDDHGDRRANYSSGCLGGEEYCNWCDEYYDEVTSVNNDNNQVCENCLEEYFVWSDDEGTHIANDEATEVQLDGGGYDWVYDCNAVWSEYHGTSILERDSRFSDAADSHVFDSDDEADLEDEFGVTKESDCNCINCNECKE